MLTRLQVYRSDGLPALYQSITLLWAFARARLGDPRLVSWQGTQRQVKDLFQRSGRTGKATASSTQLPPCTVLASGNSTRTPNACRPHKVVLFSIAGSMITSQTAVWWHRSKTSFANQRRRSPPP
jgi:hypothetical protein